MALMYLGASSDHGQAMWLPAGHNCSSPPQASSLERQSPGAASCLPHSLCPGEPSLQTTAGTLPVTPPWVARASVGARASQLVVRTSLLARSTPKLGAGTAGGRVLGGHCLGALCLPKLATGSSCLASGGSIPSCCSWDSHADLHYFLLGLSETWLCLFLSLYKSLY